MKDAVTNLPPAPELPRLSRPPFRREFGPLTFTEVVSLQRARSKGHVDVDMLAEIQFLQIGVGRDISRLELLASAGCRYFTLVDPGTVEPENVGQSGFTWNDIGKAKVEAARNHILAYNPFAEIETHAARHDELPAFAELLADADFICDGADDLSVAGDLARRAKAASADVLHIRSTGDSRQFIIAGTLCRSGVAGCIRCRLKGAFDAIDRGRTLPPFFPSFRLVPERLNIHAAWVTLGLLHHRHGSNLPIAAVGARFTQHPAWVGLNGLDPASGEIFPIREYREPVPSNWTCPACGTTAASSGLASS